MMLALDPRDPGRTRLVLVEAGHLSATVDAGDREQLFSQLIDVLETHGGVKQLERVGVVVGGGTFSGVRQAVVFARALSFTLGIPAVAWRWKDREPSPAELRRAGSPLKRVAYAGKPNITKRSAKPRVHG